MKAHIAVLGGDGIGPEVIVEGLRVLRAVAQRFGHELGLSELPFGGVAIDSHGNIYVAETDWGRRIQRFKPADKTLRTSR